MALALFMDWFFKYKKNPTDTKPQKDFEDYVWIKDDISTIFVYKIPKIAIKDWMNLLELV